MKRRHIATGAVAFTTAIAMTGVGATMAHAVGQNNDSVRLANSGRGSLSNAGLRTLGTASTATDLNLSIAVPLRNQALLNSMLANGTVISPAQYTKLFGASQASLAKVSKWAKGQGLRVVSTDAASGTVNVQASVGTVNKAFSLKMQRVALGASAGLAPNNDPQLPRTLGVTSIVGLNTVSTIHKSPQPALRQLPVRAQKATGIRTGKSLGKITSGATNVGSGNCSTYWGENVYPSANFFANESNYMCAYSPQQAVKLYNASSIANAKAKIGILLWCTDKAVVAKTNDIATHFGSPKLTNYTDASQTPAAMCASEDPGEQDMDVQVSHAIAPSAAITYYGASDNSFAKLLTMFQTAVSQHKVSTISMSWGADESQIPASFISQWERTAQRASLTGMSLFASSMDMGDGSIPDNGTKPTQAKYVSYPASSPYFTAVGGTAVATNKTGGRQFTTGWSTTWWEQPNLGSTSGVKQYPFPHNTVGAGGGVSGRFAQPAWQKGKVTGSTTKRMLPDVSADADPMTGIATESTIGDIYGGGGTSQSSPLVAALVAGSKALTGRQIGNAAPYFYKLAGTSNILDVKPVKPGTYGGHRSGPEHRHPAARGHRAAG